MLCAVAIGISGGSTTLARGQSDDAAETKEHWFQYFRGEQQVGVLKVEITRDEEFLIVRDLLVVFDHEKEILIQSEIRYRGAGSALRPARASFGVTRGNEMWLDGSLKFEKDHVLEAYRKTRDGDLIERRHSWSPKPFLTFSSLPFLAPELLRRPGEVEIVFPAIPRGLRGPVIENAMASYKLQRTEGKEYELRVRGNSRKDQRTMVAKIKDGKVLEISLEPQFRFVASRRGVCTSWHSKRAKTLPGDVTPKSGG